jgi:hypothetical protein
MVIPTDQQDPITRTLGSGQKPLGTETRHFGDTVDARPPAASPPLLAHDVLRGAAAIAEFLYGDPKDRQKVYRNSAGYSYWREGAVICARKSTLLREIAEREATRRA